MKKTLVIGATGKTGRRVSDRLKKMGHPLRLGSRNAAIPFDWHKPEAWPAALQDIDKVYITFHPDLVVPEAVPIITAFVSEARRANIQKLVLLTGRGEKEAQVCENLVINSGLDWTIIRSSWFMQNFSENIFLDSILAGQVVLPALKAKEPFVDADDIADVVVECLINDSHSKKIYEFTGPELLSFKTAVSQIARKLNRTISFQEVTIDQYGEMLREYQLPEDSIWLIKYLFNETLDGRNESVTNDVEIVLKRKPNSFDHYVNKTADTGVWDVVEEKVGS